MISDCLYPVQCGNQFVLAVIIQTYFAGLVKGVDLLQVPLLVSHKFIQGALAIS